MSHIIKKQVLELDIPKGYDSWRIQDDFKSALNAQVLPRLEQVCSELGIDHHIIRIDAMILDTGHLSARSVADEWADRVEARFREQLHQMILNKEPDQRKTNTVPVEDQELDILLHFLEKGILPWWVPDAFEFKPDQLLKKILLEQPGSFVGSIKLLSHKSAIAQRLVSQFEASGLQMLLSKYPAPPQRKLLQWLEDEIRFPQTEEQAHWIYALRVTNVLTTIHDQVKSTELPGVLPILFDQFSSKAVIPEPTALQEIYKILYINFLNSKKQLPVELKKPVQTLAEWIEQRLSRPDHKPRNATRENDRKQEEKRSSRPGHENLSNQGADTGAVKDIPSKHRPQHFNQNKQEKEKSKTIYDNESATPLPIVPDEPRASKSQLTAFSLEEGGSPKDSAKNPKSFSEEDQHVLRKIEKLRKTRQSEQQKAEGEKSKTQNLSQGQTAKKVSAFSWSEKEVTSNETESHDITSGQRAVSDVAKKETSPEHYHKASPEQSIDMQSQDLGAQNGNPGDTSRHKADFNAYQPEGEKLTTSSNREKDFDSEDDAVFQSPSGPVIEECYVENAGLVLLSPFLGHFFRHTKLVEKQQWKNRAAQERAVLLLQYLLSDEPGLDEYLLPLNKLLCAMPLDQTLDNSITPSQEEAAQCEEVLKAVIENWTALKGTSIKGLRSSFLNRKGVLKKQEDAWLLQVESMPFDMLMEQLPWTISIVRLTWMEQPIYVEW